MIGEKISFLSNPGYWIKDKIEGCIYNTSTYLIPIITWILALGSFYFSWESVRKGEGLDSPLPLLIILLAIFGVYNVIAVTEKEKYRVRLEREINAFSVLHKVCEKIRDYKTHKEKRMSEGGDYKPCKKDIIDALNHIFSLLYSEYIKPRHRRDICVTLKIQNGESVESFRYGDNTKIRDDTPEETKQSFVFRLFTEKKLRVLYIKNIEKLTRLEEKTLSPYEEQIVCRAKMRGYKTFFALPINTGNKNLQITPEIKNALGVVGFDKPCQYGFANITEQEIDFLACVVDSLSELLVDYVKAI